MAVYQIGVLLRHHFKAVIRRGTRAEALAGLLIRAGVCVVLVLVTVAAVAIVSYSGHLTTLMNIFSVGLRRHLLPLATGILVAQLILPPGIYVGRPAYRYYPISLRTIALFDQASRFLSCRVFVVTALALACFALSANPFEVNRLIVAMCLLAAIDSVSIILRHLTDTKSQLLYAVILIASIILPLDILNGLISKAVYSILSDNSSTNWILFMSFCGAVISTCIANGIIVHQLRYER